MYHRHDEKGLNWEPGGIRSGAGVRSSGVSQHSMLRLLCQVGRKTFCNIKPARGNPRFRYSSRRSSNNCNVLPKLPEHFEILYAVPAVPGASAPLEPKSTLRSLAV